MTNPRHRATLLLSAALLLDGCAGSVASYPSLAPRAIEKGEDFADPAAPADPASAPIASDVQARVATLVRQGIAGDTAFMAASREGCTAIDRGRGAAPGSEAWVAAQQALSAIEAERGATTGALDELNTLVLDQARQAQDSAKPMDLTPLIAAAADLTALDSAQSARLDAIRAQGCRPGS